MLMTQLEIVSTKIHQKLGQISAESLSKKTRVELGDELKNLEETRRRLEAEQRRIVREATIEVGSMQQELGQWHGKETEFTKRIEKSH